MASSSTLVTVDEILNVNPSLRLRLSSQSATLSSQRSLLHSSGGFFQWGRQFVETLFAEAKGDLNLDEARTEEAKRRNKEKLNKVFEKMHHKLDEQHKIVSEELDAMPVEQQEQVIKFWSAVGEFFMDLFHWLQDMFMAVVEKIRQGFVIVKDALTYVFKTAINFFKQIF